MMSHPKPNAAAVELAKKKAAAKAEAAAKKAAADARKAAEDLKRDQAWLDGKSATMDAGTKDELFRQASRNCKDTTEKDGDITLACPLPHSMQNCVEADEFFCPNGRVDGKTGCKLSAAVSTALKDDKTCIDGAFVSAEEGGSYLSPYVPWGPLARTGKMEGPKLTTGNSSGVTIGTGVDLGAVSDADAYLKKLEAAGVSRDTRDKIRPLLGKKKADACAALREAKKDGPLIFPQSDVELIDQQAIKSRVPQLKAQYEAQKQLRLKTLKAQIKAESASKTPNAAKIAALQAQIDGTTAYSDLTCAQQSVMFSTLYHEGNINSTESREFVSALLSGDDAAARAALASKSANPNKLIAARGKQELAFFDGE